MGAAPKVVAIAPPSLTSGLSDQLLLTGSPVVLTHKLFAPNCSTDLDDGSTPKIRRDRGAHERGVLNAVHHAGERCQAASDTDDMFGFWS